MKPLAAIALALAAIIASGATGVSGQYGGYGMSGGYDEHAGEEVDERPKVQLGLRLRIPAFKFELPRMTLPKITINAKIRQPDGPRTINLPEINLDTSSRLTAPGGFAAEGAGGIVSQQNANYAASASEQAYSPVHYNSNKQAERTQTFSISTDEESATRSHKTGDTSTRHNQPRYIQSPRSGPNNFHQHHAYTKKPNHNMLQHSHEWYPTKDSDLGFNSPVYIEPSSAKQFNPYTAFRQLNAQQMTANSVDHKASGGRLPVVRHRKSADY